MKIKNLKIVVILLIFFLLIFLLVNNYLNWKNNYQKTFYPEIYLENINLNKKTKTEVKKIINTKIDKIKNTGFIFKHKNKTIIIPSKIASFDADLSYSLLSFNDANAIIKKAYGNKNQRTFQYYLLKKYKLIPPQYYKISYALNVEKTKELLKKNFPNLNIDPQNAYFSINNKSQLKINPEEPGLEINYSEALENLKKNLDNLNSQPIFIKTHSKYPLITKNDLLPIEPLAKTFINHGNLILETKTFPINYWEISTKKIITWLSINKNNKKIQISLDEKKIKNYLEKHISPLVNKPAISPIFKINKGKASYWKNGINGQKLDLEASVKQISKDFLARKNKSILIINEVPTEKLTGTEKLDIKTILGTGESDFGYSPKNRVHNIKVGASTLQGVLIKPQEEFSLTKTLGKIDDQAGYLKELVIKDNKTIPEYGGGLCQIATTMFRAALASGLPITERQNHSYRVSYYEPAGTDATIYDPQPDLRFINNTGHYILIQARITGHKLYFDFWGTSDGRIASTTTPVIYNITKPEKTKIIKTTSLKPGEKKCTEHSHNGADTYFDYTVSYPFSTTTPIYKHRFRSHYEPWQAVCLVGEKTTTSTTTLNTKLNKTNNSLDKQ